MCSSKGFVILRAQTCSFGLRHSHLMILLTSILLSLCLIGCGTLENGRGWGQDINYPVDLNRISRAAHNAFFDLQTLIPAGGALLFAIDNFDERASDWATRHSPIFGSEEGARDAGDYLGIALQVEVLATALATPSGDEPKEWVSSKSKGLAVELAALGTTEGATELLKAAANRPRPTGESTNSFPSSHSSWAFSCATLANRNLDSIDLPRNLKRSMQIGNLCLASGVAWARVEARAHYPSDVLAGAALGHFMTAFIHDAFLDLPEDGSVGFAVFPVEGGAGIQLAVPF
jgi:membrane-associated phospholipid phosphatase